MDDDWKAAMELVVAHTRHEPYRAKCADDHPDRDVWRRKMLEKAAALAGKPVPEYPPILRQVANATAAAGRVVSAVVHAQPVLVAPEEAARRLEVCRACDRYDPAYGRCTACGCACGWKASLDTETCPLDKW